MARTFVTASSEYLERNGTPPVSNAPMTFACWFKVADQNNALMQACDKDQATYRLFLSARGDLSDQIRFTWTEHGGASSNSADSSTGYTADTWQHACGVVVSRTELYAYLNGGSKGSDDGGSPDPEGGTWDNISIGAARDSTPGGYTEGAIAEAAMWSVALSDAEVAALGDGYSPLFIRPAALVFYAPLGGMLTAGNADYDIVGGLTLTAGGTPTTEDHPRIIYPSDPMMGVEIAAAPAGDTPSLTLLGVG